MILEAVTLAGDGSIAAAGGHGGTEGGAQRLGGGGGGGRIALFVTDDSEWSGSTATTAGLGGATAAASGTVSWCYGASGVDCPGSNGSLTLVSGATVNSTMAFTRNLHLFTQDRFRWNDTSTKATTLRYTLSGVVSSMPYRIFVGGSLADIVESSVTGVLDFTASLAANTETEILAYNDSISTTLPLTTNSSVQMGGLALIVADYSDELGSSVAGATVLLNITAPNATQTITDQVMTYNNSRYEYVYIPDALGVYNLSTYANKTYYGSGFNSSSFTSTNITLSIALNTSEEDSGRNVSVSGTMRYANGSVAAGLPFDVYLNETVQASSNGTSNASGEYWTEFTAPATHGDYVVRVSAQDNDGVTGENTTAFSVLENTPPEITVSAPANGTWFAQDSFTITLTALDNRTENLTYLVYLDAAQNASGSVLNDTETNISVGLVSDATYSVVVEITDHLGAATNSSPFVVHVDTTDPIPAVLSPAENSWTNVALLVNVSATDAMSATQNYTLFVNGTAYYTNSLANGSSEIVPVIGLADGEHTLRLEATDIAGNSANSSAVNVTMDTAVPSASLSSPANQSWFKVSTVNVTFSITDTLAPNGTYRLFVDGSVNDSGSALNGSDTKVTVATLADGQHTAQAEGTDLAGNAANSTSILFTVDTAAASTTVAHPASGSSVPVGPLDVRFTVTDAHAATIDYDLFLNGSLNGSGTAVNGTEEAVPLPWIALGDYALELRTQDLAGNNASVSHNFSVIKRNATLAASASPSVLRIGTSVKLASDYENASTQSIGNATVNATVTLPDNTTQEFNLSYNSSSSAYEVTFTPAQIGQHAAAFDASHALYADANASASFTVSNMSVNVTLAPSSVSTGEAVLVSVDAAYPNGSAVPNATYTVSIDGTDSSGNLSGGAVNVSIIAPSTGGTFAVTADVTDTDGVVGQGTASLTVSAPASSGGGGGSSPSISPISAPVTPPAPRPTVYSFPSTVSASWNGSATYKVRVRNPGDETRTVSLDIIEGAPGFSISNPVLEIPAGDERRFTLVYAPEPEYGPSRVTLRAYDGIDSEGVSLNVVPLGRPPAVRTDQEVTVELNQSIPEGSEATLELRDGSGNAVRSSTYSAALPGSLRATINVEGLSSDAYDLCSEWEDADWSVEECEPFSIAPREERPFLFPEIASTEQRRRNLLVAAAAMLVLFLLVGSGALRWRGKRPFHEAVFGGAFTRGLTVAMLFIGPLLLINGQTAAGALSCVGALALAVGVAMETHRNPSRKRR